NVKKQETDFLRGYSATIGTSRPLISDRSLIGGNLKESLLNPQYGAWRIGSGMSGETIPKETNTLSLDNGKVDKWGVPLLKIAVKFDENDEKMILDYMNQMEEMFEAAGVKNIRKTDAKDAPGLDIHEMGGVR